MYKHLQTLGILEPKSVEHFTIRSETEFDILKIYHRKKKGELFAKSEKFKFPRQKKRMHVHADGKNKYHDVSEISTTLRYVVEELDQLCKHDVTAVDIRKKILSDLRHLEGVVKYKISEIEADLAKL